MATTAGEAVQLSREEQDAVTECMKSLDEAQLQQESDSEVDLNGLDGIVQNFVQKFDPWTKLGSKDSRFTALRFTKAMILTVPRTVILIPTAITSNNPTIGKQTLTIGSYIYLTEDVLVEPGFHCLAFLAQ